MAEPYRRRVRADALQRGHVVKLEGRRVHLNEVHHDRLPGFVVLAGSYYEAPDFSRSRPLHQVIKATRKVTVHNWADPVLGQYDIS